MNLVFCMAMLLGSDFLKCYSTLAKCLPSVPFREGLQLEWSPSQWHRRPLSHETWDLGSAFPCMFDLWHV